MTNSGTTHTMVVAVPTQNVGDRQSQNRDQEFMPLPKEERGPDLIPSPIVPEEVRSDISYTKCDN